MSKLTTHAFRDVQKLNETVMNIVAERKSRLKRYVRAKVHYKRLQGVAKKLDDARGNYLVRLRDSS